MSTKPYLKMFYDLETTGLSYKKHCIHNMSGFICSDDRIVEVFDFYFQPHPKALIDPIALQKGNVSEELIRSYRPQNEVFYEFRKMLNRYTDRFDKETKIILVGFNNRKFDDFFLQTLFSLNADDAGFISYFYPETLDVMVLAGEYLQRRRRGMKNFKLKTVAKELGLLVEEEKLHKSAYDTELTYQMYNIVTRRQIEI